jgi:hypothetical protein
MATYGNDYFKGSTNDFIDFSTGLFILSAAIWTLCIVFKGAGIVQETKRRRSILFLIVLPLFFYGLIITALVVNSPNQEEQVLKMDKQVFEERDNSYYLEKKEPRKDTLLPSEYLKI